MKLTDFSRREFLHSAAFFAAGTAVVRGSKVFARQGPEVPRRFIIDAHQHFSPEKDYVERLVKIYASRNAMACVLTPMAGFETIKAAAAKYPDVIIPYGHLSVDSPDILKDIQKCSDAGFKGIKMTSPRKN